MDVAESFTKLWFFITVVITLVFPDSAARHENDSASFLIRSSEYICEP